ncbi:MAG TPA: hypothetical protein VLV56_07120 [Burkholderiales bacterium]|nr:hypothetical protein [Burkholderiales bacterium]
MPAVAERSLATLRREIAEHLRGVRQRLAEEIRTYPTPIPRCDAQFNHLYEQQGRLARELDRLEPTRESIGRFIASAPYTDDPAEREFRSRVKAALAALR